MDTSRIQAPPEIKLIPLTQGKYAIVDKEHYLWLNRLNWHFSKNRYAATTINYKHVYMHRFILNASKDMQVDHINNDGLDNRMGNLRLATSKQNHYNHKRLSNNKSGYNGVSKTRFNKWHACISINRKTKHLGTFEKIEDAALAYNEAAKQYFGEFARLNKIGERYV